MRSCKALSTDASGTRAWYPAPMESMLLILGVTVLLLLLVFRLVSRQQRRRVRTHARLGRRAESEGYRLLERRGFVLVERQAVTEVVVEVDGEAQTFTVRADALVERDGRRFVAEIKGGEENASLTSRATRRQLLEYAFAFGVDEVLLVDPGQGRVSRVRFRPKT